MISVGMETNTLHVPSTLMNSLFLKKILEDKSLFFGATDIPVLDFW